MSQSTVSDVVREQFNQHVRLVYAIARKAARRYCPADVEEFVQDAACRAYGRFVQRCAKHRQRLTPDEVKTWVAQCAVYAAKDALRKSAFGAVSDQYAIRDDATARFRRVRPNGSGRADSAGFGGFDVEDTPVRHEVQEWEVAEAAGCLPEPLRATAINAAMGLTQPESAKRQGCSERTIRNHLTTLREILDPMPTTNRQTALAG